VATILLADDDMVLRDMYRMRLVREGYVVHEAVDGQDVLDKVKSAHPDLILLDIMMPKMNGLDVLKLLKSDKETQKIPVIILTALLQDLSQVNNSSGKADGYIIKSEVMPDQVVARVKQFLGPKSDTPAQESPSAPSAAVS